VFFQSLDDLKGQTVTVTVTHTSPWSLQGEVASEAVPLPVVA
jgi:hypothetical protein